MKKLPLIVTGMSLLSIGGAWAAINCTPSPDCVSLGYKVSASSCKGDFIACPFDTSKVACLENAPECPSGYYKDCTAEKSYWVNDLSQSPTTLSDGTKCYKCRSYTCSDYGYMESMPSSSQIGTGCSGKMYNSCSSRSVSMPSSSGNVNRTCYSCISNPYGTGRSKVIYCSSSQGYAGAGNYCCGAYSTTQNCDGTGGCMKM
ncbi:MAG: hypothetical protein KHX55_07815 [Proteobacteria bacterium]|nr:hypothetical protein [Pseudomonadota bacterium]